MESNALQLLALQETMTTVNNVVMNRLMIIQFVVDQIRLDMQVTHRHISAINQAVSEIAAHLHAISDLEQYETEELLADVRVVKYHHPPPDQVAQRQ